MVRFGKGPMGAKNHGKLLYPCLMPFCEMFLVYFYLISSHTGLGDNAVMRPPPPGQEEAPNLAKNKKRERGSPSDTPKPKKSKARKSKKNTATLPADVVQKLEMKKRRKKMQTMSWWLEREGTPNLKGS